MRVTRHTDYALRVLMFLGLKPIGQLSTIKEIAERYGISDNHLMKVVHQLGQHGFITTVRGRQGGIRLARAVADINLGAVVRATESDLDIVECFSPARNTCRIAPLCALTGIFSEALGAFLAVLDGYSLADILGPSSDLAALLGVEAKKA